MVHPDFSLREWPSRIPRFQNSGAALIAAAPCRSMLSSMAHRDDIINRDARFDWAAAVWGGLIAGAVVWLLSHGIPWFTSGMVSPTLMGRDLKPPGLVDPFRSAMTILAQAVVSVAYAFVIALLVTRLRGMWAVGLGMLIGVGLYALNFLVFHFLLTVDWTGGELAVLVTHVVFAAMAAGAYKGLAARRAGARRTAEGV